MKKKTTKREVRNQLNEEIEQFLQAIDQRKEAKRSRPARKAPPRKVPKQKVIYDDFGEPLRVVWQDE